MITIALCAPPVSSQQQTTIPLSTPMFTDSTIPPTTSIIPPFSVNVSDTGARTSDEDLGGEGVTYSPFQIWTESEDEAVVDSADVCKAMTEKVNKLISDTSTFMENFQNTFNSNTTTANEAIKSLGSLLKTEKTKLQEIRIGLKTDHETFQTSISSQFSKLQDELEKERNIKDSFALKTREVKVLRAKLEASEK
ncbi:unnamed protein product [Lactuca saligna]|uniref:Uncharacterized protein n=1 Tax=Lactuca saligna TaxID=75948 RepID=A0AA36A2K9_LACSI|nr:unnamed protein product [Lactuca saligna]